MMKLMVGNNLDWKFVKLLPSLNQKYDGIKINEVFGSIRNLRTENIKTARPDFRVPDLDEGIFKEINEYLNENDIIPNYTINSPILDHKKITKKEVEGFMTKLKTLGIKRVTVAHPLLMKLISEVSDMSIEVSTIYRVRHPRQIFDLLEYAPNIDKICAEVNINRDRHALIEQIEYCKQLNIQLELLANEFCIYQCIVRDQCYHAHVMNTKVEDTYHFNGFPMGYCISHREHDPKEWLYANFILPQHMKIYNELFGINSFKITGRTAPTPYLSWVVETYMKQDFRGNLLELWQDVKNLSRVAKGHDDFLKNNHILDASLLDEKFIEFYLCENQPISYEKEQEHIISYLNKIKK